MTGETNKDTQRLIALLQDIKAWDIDQAATRMVNGEGLHMALPEDLRERLQHEVTRCDGFDSEKLE